MLPPRLPSSLFLAYCLKVFFSTVEFEPVLDLLELDFRFNTPLLAPEVDLDLGNPLEPLRPPRLERPRAPLPLFCDLPVELLPE